MKKNKKLKTIITNNVILNTFISLLTFLALKIYNGFSFFNIFTILLFGFLMWFYSLKIEYDKKTRNYSFCLSLLLSAFLSVGNVVSRNLNIWNIGFLSNLNNIIRILFMLIGFMPLIFKLIVILFTKLNKINITKENNKLSKKELLIMFAILFLAWIPFFLRYFPAAMTPDSYYVVHYANEKILSDHHTFGFTWFFAIFFYLGKSLFSTLNSAIAVYTIFQILLMDLIFIFGLNYLSKQKINKKIIYCLFAFIAINPLFSHYAITLWRDVLFGMMFIIITLILHNYVFNNYNLKLKEVCLFTLSVLLMMFFRNNGIYVFIFMCPFIILMDKKKILLKSIYCISIIAFYFIIKGPVFTHFNVSKGIESEAYSIPIQQISRVVASDEKIDDDTFKFLEKLYNTDIVKEQYDPTISDNMKRTIDVKFLNENKSKFFKNYIILFTKHPVLYFEGYFTQTLGYWYPDIDRWATAGKGESFFEKEVKVTPKTNDTISNLLDKTLTRKIPFVSIFWSIGLNVYLLVICTAYALYKFGKKVLIYFSPLYGVWASLMIASPVYCEHRYIFSLFVTIPFLLLLQHHKGDVSK